MDQSSTPYFQKRVNSGFGHSIHILYYSNTHGFILLAKALRPMSIFETFSKHTNKSPLVQINRTGSFLSRLRTHAFDGDRHNTKNARYNGKQKGAPQEPPRAVSHRTITSNSLYTNESSVLAQLRSDVRCAGP